MFSAPLRGPPWIKGVKGVKGVLRAPSRPFVDQKVLRCSPRPSAALRGSKVFQDVKGLRAPSRPFVDQKVLRCSPCPSCPSVDRDVLLPLRGSKGFKMFSVPLRGPPWIKGVKGVLRAPSRPFVDQKVLRCSPRPSAALRGSKGFKMFSVPLRGPSSIKRCYRVRRAPP